MCGINSLKGLEKFCDACKKERSKEYNKEHSAKLSAIKASKKKMELKENFLKLDLTGLDLLPGRFSSKSVHSHFSYQRNYRMKWIDVLKYFNKDKELIDSLVKGFITYYETTGLRSISGYAKSLGSSQVFFDSLDHEAFRNAIGAVNHIHVEENYKKNFDEVREELGYIPLYPEFRKISKITTGTYAVHLGLKGIIYDNIVKEYASEEDFNEYKIRQQESKATIGRENHQGFRYTDEDLELEFRRVFDDSLSKTNKNPSRKVFNQLSKYDDSVYRHRFKTSYGEIVEMYGYQFDATNNKSERLVISTVAEILDDEAIPQKTFEWLKSDKNYLLRCDGYYPKYNLVVEFDGRQHYEAIEEWGGAKGFESVKANDLKKDSLLPQHGIKIVRISCYDPFWEKDFIKSKLIESGILEVINNK